MLINSNKNYLGNVVSAKLGNAEVDFLYSKLVGQNFKNGDVSIHLHTHAEVVFMLSGSCRLVSENKVCILKEGSVCIIPAGVVHSFDLVNEESRGFSFQINTQKDSSADLGDLNYYKEVFSAFDNALILVNMDKEIEYIKDFLKFSQKKGGNAFNISITLLKLSFLSVVEKIAGIFNIDCVPVTNSMEQKNMRVSDDYVLENYIMDNYTKNITIEDIAGFVGYSSTYTARKIKKIYGLTYSELLIKLRMNYAWREIIFTDKHLFQISEEVGYNSYNGFGLAFKKFYKKTPEQIRNDYSEKYREVSK